LTDADIEHTLQNAKAGYKSTGSLARQTRTSPTKFFDRGWEISVRRLVRHQLDIRYQFGNIIIDYMATDGLERYGYSDIAIASPERENEGNLVGYSSG